MRLLKDSKSLVLLEATSKTCALPIWFAIFCAISCVVPPSLP